MVPPSVVIENGMGRRRLARSFSWGVAAERLVNAIFVVINSELFQLSLQVDCVPDEYVIIRTDGTRGTCGIDLISSTWSMRKLGSQRGKRNSGSWSELRSRGQPAGRRFGPLGTPPTGR